MNTPASDSNRDANFSGPASHNPYETPELVFQYLLFHYGEPQEVLPWDFGPRDALDFAVRAVTENLQTDLLPDAPSALDLGCAVGRSSFELARTHTSVLGIDFSQAFVDVADQIAKNGELHYHILEHGEIQRPAVARVDPAIDCSRVSFQQGDACNLPGDLGPFDTVLAANLLCRLPDPAACLQRLKTLVKPGGQVIFTTPSTWLEEYTPKDRWLGGYPGEDGIVQTIDGIMSILSGSFEMISRHDMPFLIREHERKYQWSVAEASVWKKL